MMVMMRNDGDGSDDDNDDNRAVIKWQGLGISPGYYERGTRLISKEGSRRKIEQKKSLAV